MIPGLDRMIGRTAKEKIGRGDTCRAPFHRLGSVARHPSTGSTQWQGTLPLARLSGRAPFHRLSAGTTYCLCRALAGWVAAAETRNRKLLTNSVTRWGRRTPKLHTPGPSPAHGAGTLASA